MQRFFGAGPICSFVGIVLVFIVYYLERQFGIQGFIISGFISNVILIISTVLTFTVIIWSFISLPPYKRGKELATNGAYRHIRHPIYAAFLVFVVIGIGLYLGSYGILLMGIVLILICGRLIEIEEKHLLKKFGSKYEEYQKRTKKFIPWIY